MSTRESKLLASPTPRRSGVPRTWTLAALAAVTLTGFATAQGTIKVVSRSSSGELGGSWGLYGSTPPMISGDGLRVSFSSSEPLVAEDTNGQVDVFWNDRITGKTSRVSISTAGVEANGACDGAVISQDGRWIGFESESTNLVPGDVNGFRDVFLRDLSQGTTTLISAALSGSPGNGFSFLGSVSGDGRYVAFYSTASDLVAGDAGPTDVFVRDATTSTTILASRSSSGEQGNDESSSCSLSSNGRFLAFASNSTNLDQGDTNGRTDVFLRDLLAGTTIRVSISSTGVQGNQGSSISSSQSVSDDGRFVVFPSYASNLVPGDLNLNWDVFLRDVTSGTTELVSVHLLPTAPIGGGSYQPWISRDGSRVVFCSRANDLIPVHERNFLDIYVRTLATGTTELVSQPFGGGQGNRGSTMPSMSDDGRFIVFDSDASNMVGGELQAVNGPPIYLLDRQGCSPMVATYCTAGTTTHGCVPSMAATGTASGSAGAGFTLSATSVEGGVPGLIFYGVHGPAAIPFGASTLCVRDPLQRMSAQSAGGTPGACDGILSADWNQYIATHAGSLGQPFVDGATVWAQAWFRDPAAPGGSNLSDAIWFDVCP